MRKQSQPQCCSGKEVTPAVDQMDTTMPYSTILEFCGIRQLDRVIINVSAFSLVRGATTSPLCPQGLGHEVNRGDDANTRAISRELSL
jgi:hypothetical protein